MGAPAAEWSIEVPLVSHFDTPLYRTEVGADFLGASAVCQVDIACVYQIAPETMQSGIVNANFGVALMTFTRTDGLSYTCTGTLLNNLNYPRPIFLTAFHCLDDAGAIASLTTTWFYNRVSYGSGPANLAAVHIAEVGHMSVGAATFSFKDGNNGVFAYNLDLGDGVNKANQTKAITRQVFRGPGTVCQ